MPEINRRTLERVVDYYIKNDDPETARNYVKTWGQQIKGFDIDSELKKLELKIKKPKGGK